MYNRTLTISGSRSFYNKEIIIGRLKYYLLYLRKCGVNINVINVGDAKGVDEIIRNIESDEECSSGNYDKDCISFTIYKYTAEWEKHGKGAGPIRNRAMLVDSDYLLAFPSGDSRGTHSAINIAKELNLTIRQMYLTTVHSLAFEYLYFYREKDNDTGFLSNFYICEFSQDNIDYISSEQYFMKKKQELFDPNNDELADRIMNETSQSKIKKLGRKVENFDESVWNDERMNIMISALEFKFGSNNRISKALRSKLIHTEFKILVEASPSDKVWGIGMSVNEAENSTENEWNGLNLLGKSLMMVRDKLRYNSELYYV